MIITVLKDSLNLFWKGMATIVLAMLLICVLIYLLNFFTNSKRKVVNIFLLVVGICFMGLSSFAILRSCDKVTATIEEKTENKDEYKISYFDLESSTTNEIMFESKNEYSVGDTITVYINLNDSNVTPKTENTILSMYICFAIASSTFIFSVISLVKDKKKKIIKG